MRLEPKEAPAPSTELAVINIAAIVPVEFFKAGGSDDILTQLEASVRAEAAKLDISTDAGRRAIASLAYKVACSKKPLEDLKKGLTEDIRKQKEAVDAEGRRAIERLQSLQDEVRKPLTDWENAEKQRVADHEAAILALRSLSLFEVSPTIGDIELAMDSASLAGRRDWQEFAKRAADAQKAVLFELSAMLATARQAEADRIEAERLRKEAEEKAIQEREEAAARKAKEEAERRAEEHAKAAREAAEAEQRRLERERIEAEARAKQAEAQRLEAIEQAKRDAEFAEQKRIAAEREAARVLEAEKQAAAKREQEAAERAEREREQAIEAERQRVAAKAKADAEETEKRARNRAHQAAVNREVLAALATLNISDELGKLLIGAIAKGAIPHVTINY
jgi:colicin import membrane protein